MEPRQAAKQTATAARSGRGSTKAGQLHFDYFHGYAAAYDSARHREMARLQRGTARKWKVDTREWGSE